MSSSVTTNKTNQGLLSKLFGIDNGATIHDSSPLKPRKAPIKVEPKVFFANER
jgi:hypothetical protein